MNLTKVAITRPVFIFMLMVAAIMMGSLATNTMQVEQNPPVEFGFITIQTPYPGAGPDEVNELVSKPIEDVVSGLTGLQSLTSSSQEGISSIGLQFAIGTDMTEALNDVRSKIDTVVAVLPTDVRKPTVFKLDTTTEPVLTLAINSSILRPQQLRELADKVLKDRFASIDGVANVDISGGEIREIQVQVKRDKLLEYKIGISELLRAISGNNLNVPSGRIQQSDKEFTVRVVGRFQSVDDIRNLVFSKSDPSQFNSRGKLIRLSDVATITDTIAEKRQSSRLNGKDAVIIDIQKSRDGNAVAIAESAKGVIAELTSAYPIEMITTQNSATDIEESIKDLFMSLLFGIILVVSIIYLFLHNLRSTIIVGIAIPICLLGTMVIIKGLGFTLNNMSMLALSLAIGVLVDDAIVVIENINRHLRMGEDPEQAAINGRMEIGLAALAITLVDVAVFLPIGFMGGVVGRFFRQLGITFAITVLLSLFVSFTVTPMLAARWFKKGEDLEHPKDWLARSFEKVFGVVTEAYRRTLKRALKHNNYYFAAGYVGLIGMFMAIAGTFSKSMSGAIQTGIPMMVIACFIGVVVFIWNLLRRKFQPKYLLFGFLFGLVFPVGTIVGFKYHEWKQGDVFKFAFAPPSDQGTISIDVELPPGSNLGATTAVVADIEKIVMRHPDVRYVTSNVGNKATGFGSGASGTNLAGIKVTLLPKRTISDNFASIPGLSYFAEERTTKLRTRSSSAVSADLNEMIGRIPGVRRTIAASSGFGFGQPIQMSFTSNDREKLVATVQKIREKLVNNAIEGVIDVDISSKPGKPEIRAIPDRTKLADSGVTAAQLADAMRTLYEGNDDVKYRENGLQYDVRVMMDMGDRNDPNQIASLPVAFDQGNPVYLSTVATIEPATSVDKIDRLSRQEEIRITANLLPGFATGTVQKNISDWMEKEHLVPPEVKVKPLGEADVQARETGYLFTALFLGVILVYMVMASLFNNLLYPLIIQLAQPQALVGALLALMLTDKTFNIVGFIGVIALAGLVGKNAILLVDYTNTLRERGMSREEALIEAGPIRFRPIMMTTIAVILGMLPVALAIGAGSEFRETIGITIIGGMIVSTVLTLVIIPCSYIVFDNLAQGLGKGVRTVAGLFAPKPKA